MNVAKLISVNLIRFIVLISIIKPIRLRGVC